MTTSPRVPSPSRPIRALGLAFGVTAVLLVVELLAKASGQKHLAALVAVLVYGIPVVFGVLAAAVFGRGDHLRRAWLFIGIDYLFLLVGRLLYPGELLGLADSPSLIWARAVATIGSNALAALGTAIFAATWLHTGLPKPGTQRGRFLIAALLGVLVLCLVGPDLVASLSAAAEGDVYAGALVVADLTDMAVFLLMVPVLFTARALSGGSLAWPFGLLCASDVAWLLLDGFATYGAILGVGNMWSHAINGALRTLACLLFASAALVQRQVIRGAARSAARP